MRLLITLLLLLTSHYSYGQNDCPECEKFKIVGVYDFGPPPGGNWIIILLTVSEDLDPGFDPHYSSLFFGNAEGDTITKPTGASLTLPQSKKDTIPYMLELNTDLSNQNFPEDFDGYLIIRTPTGGFCPNVTWCHLPFSKLVTFSDNIFDINLSTKVYPNPATDHIFVDTDKHVRQINIYNLSGKLMITEQDYLKGKSIDLSEIQTDVIWVEIVFKDRHIDWHPVLVIK